jgi:preprotein translocase subunit SecB
MKNLKPKESGFTVNSIVLLESSFTRLSNVTFNNPEVKHLVDVNVDVGFDNNNIIVTEVVSYSQTYLEIEEVSATIKMVGVFELIGESVLDKNEFGYVNGAAIIFPYIRECLSSLSLKAGIGPIILPPFNFTEKQKA